MSLPLKPPLRSYQLHNDTIAPLHTSASSTVYLDEHANIWTIPPRVNQAATGTAKGARARTTARRTTALVM